MRRRMVALLGVASMLMAAAVADAVEPEPRALFASTDSRVSLHDRGSEFAPDIAYNPLTLEFLVVWMDDRDFDTSRFDIWGQRVSSTTGQNIGLPIRISSVMATGTERNPSVAFSPDDNRYLVVWDDDRRDPGFTRGVFGRFVDGETGNPIGNDVPFTPWIQYTEQQHPAVAYNPVNGAFVVVWQDGRDLFTRGQDVYMSLIDATTRRKLIGNRRVSPVRAVANEERPAVDVDPNSGDVLIVWQDSRSGSLTPYDIWSRLYGADRRSRGPARRISPGSATGNDRVPEVRYNPSSAVTPNSTARLGLPGPFYVVWEDDRNLNSRGTDIFGAQVAATGRRVGGAKRVSTPAATANERNPKVHVDPGSGNFLVVFEDTRNSEIFGVDIRARRVDANANAYRGDFAVPGNGAPEQYWPVVAFGNGAHGVAWIDFRYGEVDFPPDGPVAVSDIYFRLVTP